MNRKLFENGLEVLRQEEIQIEDWNSFVENCFTATVFHLPEWSRILEKSFGYESYNLFARNQDGHLCAMLPLSLVKSPLTGSRLVSLPFCHYCGPISTSNFATVPLIEEAKRLSRTLKCDYLEIKVMNGGAQHNDDSFWLQSGFARSDQFSTYVLRLAQPDIVWKKLDSTRRWAVRKAQKDGVVVRKSNSPTDIRLFYHLNFDEKRRMGIPGHPEAFFQNMFEDLGRRCQLYLAEFNGRIIAGIITIKFHRTVSYGYAASIIKYRTHQPNILLTWTAIQDSCSDGCEIFDFGRVSSAETGLIIFKRHWGTEEKKLGYCYYPDLPKSMALSPYGIKYRLATRIWKKTPLPLARVGGKFIFKHLG
jgi:FemAB-related protein (PEP-CTERM system-associated)